MAPAGPMRFEKPPRQVMETFHFHLFSVPVVLLIIAHLFMMCELATRFKVGVIIASNAATFVHLLAPPIIQSAEFERALPDPPRFQPRSRLDSDSWNLVADTGYALAKFHAIGGKSLSGSS